MKTAREVVEIYLDKIWHQGELDLIAAYCADPIIRHDPNNVTRLSHAEQSQRIAEQREELAPVFDNVILTADDEFVTLVYNTDCKKSDWKPCGIEIFKVTSGVISEVWNSPYVDGRWG